MNSDIGAGGRISFMDCNCRIGRFEHLEAPYFTDIAGLIAELNYLGIDDALVMHSWSWRWSPRFGNEKLDEEIASYDNLYPCYVGLPAATEELPPPDEFAAYVGQQHGAVGMRS